MHVRRPIAIAYSPSGSYMPICCG
eukprot:COSAG05_NODE_22670_length_263_cov_0.634146_1_plen_23_part_01